MIWVLKMRHDKQYFNVLELVSQPGELWSGKALDSQGHKIGGQVFMVGPEIMGSGV